MFARNLIKSIIFALFFLTFQTLSSYSQSSWFRQYPDINNLDIMTSIYFLNSSTGYAVGASSTIIKTTNAGANWITLPTGIGAILYSIYFTDANTGYAAGERTSPNIKGVILKTTNGGEKLKGI